MPPPNGEHLEIRGPYQPLVNEYDPMNERAKHQSERWFELLRRECPVHHHVLPDLAAAEGNGDGDDDNSNYMLARPSKEFWSIFRYGDCVSALQDDATFSSREGPGPERIRALNDVGMLIHADKPAHNRQRRIVVKAISPSAVAQLRGHICAVANQIVDDIADRGQAELMSDFAAPFTIRVLAEVMGVDETHVSDLHRWGADSVAAMGRAHDPEIVERAFEATREMSDYLLPKILTRIDLLERGEELPPGILSALVSAEHEGSRFDVMEVFMAAHQLLSAGFETTSTAIVSAVALLCTHPEERDKLVRDPGRMPDVIEEILRLASPLEGLFRTTTREVEVAGTLIPKGAKVRIVWASANHDDAIFDDPLVFRTDRDRTEVRKHLSFGTGRHSCVGAALARSELAIAIDTLLHRLPDLDLDPAAPPERNHSLIINGYNSLPVRWSPAQVRPARTGVSTQQV